MCRTRRGFLRKVKALSIGMVLMQRLEDEKIFLLKFAIQSRRDMSLIENEMHAYM